MELVLTGSQIGADEAKSLGLVSHVLPPEEVLPAAQLTLSDVTPGSGPSPQAPMGPPPSAVTGPHMQPPMSPPPPSGPPPSAVTGPHMPLSNLPRVTEAPMHSGKCTI